MNFDMSILGSYLHNQCNELIHHSQKFPRGSLLSSPPTRELLIIGEKRFTYEEKKIAGRNKLAVSLGALLGWNWVLETYSPYDPELSVPVSAEESIEASHALCDQKTLPFIPHKFIKYFHTPSTQVGRDHAFIILRGIKLSSWSHGTSPCTSKKNAFYLP